MDRNTLETILDHLTSGIVLTMLIALALLACGHLAEARSRQRLFRVDCHLRLRCARICPRGLGRQRGLPDRELRDPTIPIVARSVCGRSAVGLRSVCGQSAIGLTIGWVPQGNRDIIERRCRVPSMPNVRCQHE